MHFQSVVFSGNPMILAGIGLKTQYLAPCLQPGLRHHKNLKKKKNLLRSPGGRCSRVLLHTRRMGLKQTALENCASLTENDNRATAQG